MLDSISRLAETDIKKFLTAEYGIKDIKFVDAIAYCKDYKILIIKFRTNDEAACKWAAADFNSKALTIENSIEREVFTAKSMPHSRYKNLRNHELSVVWRNI